MKHYLSLLCFALTSFFLTDKAVANLLLKQNPTPLEPVSYASSGESYQLAKVTWLPDYLGNNKSYGNKRADTGGKNKNDRGCATYGLLDSCAEHRVGKGAKHPIGGLTCYEECICDTSYYKYTAITCRSPKIPSESCSDLKKVSSMSGNTNKSVVSSEQSETRQTGNLGGITEAGGAAINIKKYARCTCPEEYNLSSCPKNATCGTCDSKYKFISCKDGYTKTSSGTCEAMSCSSYGGYDVCPAGYGVTENFSTPAGNHCVKCSQCAAGTYSKGTGPCVACACGTYAPQARTSSCIACASGSYQTATGQTSCKTVAHVEGWTISTDKCTITKKSCAAGYTAGVTTCSKGAYSSSGYSGDEVCGKCTLNDTCPTGYSKTACTSSQTQTGSTTTEAGSTCYKCENIAACTEDCSKYQKHENNLTYITTNVCKDIIPYSQGVTSGTCCGITYLGCSCTKPHLMFNNDYSACVCEDDYVLMPDGQCVKQCFKTDTATSKPDNSTYVEETCQEGNNTYTIKTGWKCDFGYVKRYIGGTYICQDVRKTLSSGNKSYKCEYGDYLYEDRTCSATLLSDKKPIGVVFKGEGGLLNGKSEIPCGKALALTDGRYPLANTVSAGFMERISASGKEQTQIYIETCDRKKVSCPAFDYIRTYTANGNTLAGEWYMLNENEWNTVFHPKDSGFYEFDNTFQKRLGESGSGNIIHASDYGPTTTLPEDSIRGRYWTSTLTGGGSIAYTPIYLQYAKNGALWFDQYVGFDSGYYVRPAIEFVHNASCLFHTLKTCPANANCSSCGGESGVKLRIESCHTGYSAVWEGNIITGCTTGATDRGPQGSKPEACQYYSSCSKICKCLYESGERGDSKQKKQVAVSPYAPVSVAGAVCECDFNKIK